MRVAEVIAELRGTTGDEIGARDAANFSASSNRNSSCSTRISVLRRVDTPRAMWSDRTDLESHRAETVSRRSRAMFEPIREDLREVEREFAVMSSRRSR